ncbi:MAG: acyl-CoA synthetase (AMP-forming)/AMP-acid ligase II [Acidimicrobiales bacterium]|jgi:acyl-CoA synthetase (AMP-forming)/AMP-acid ligase II
MTPSDPAMTLDDACRAAVVAHPDAIALVDAPNRSSYFSGEPVRLTWSEVDSAVDSLATSLSALGAGPGASVALQLPNVAELVLNLLACFRIGATAVPFPIQHRSHELNHGLRVARPRLFVTGARPDRPDQIEVVSRVIAEQEADVIVVDCTTDPHPDAEPQTWRASSSAPPAAANDGADVVTICWTSGTTGTPKGVPRTNTMWLASGGFQVDQLHLNSNDRILCPFPVVNMAGIGGMVVPWLMTGATLHLHQPLDLPVFLQQASDERITYTVAPPPLLNMLLANPAMLDSVDISSLRRISSGSAPLDPGMVEGWQDRGVEIVNVFGSNEGASMLSTQAMVPDPTERARFFRRPDRDGIETRLVDLQTGTEITEPGTVGELRFIGKTVFDGYLESDGSEFDERGFYRTGDLFEWVGDDRPPSLLRFVDRAKDIIIRGGMNISAAEVEGLIASHPTVVECAAVAYPDAELGERLGVFVVGVEGTTPTLDAVVDHLRQQDVASYKLPERLELIDALPRNPVGKVTKPSLRETWATAT